MDIYRVSSDLAIYSNIPPGEFQSKYEVELLMETLQSIKIFDINFYKKFDVCVLLNNGVNIQSWDIERSEKKRVYIIFDELGRIPFELVDDSPDFVFHAHMSFSDQERPHYRLFHYPLGCNSFVPVRPYIPAGERKINVFFSGNLHIGRRCLYEKVSNLYKVPFPILVRLQKVLQTKFDSKFSDSYIRFTNGFSRGLTFQEYGDYLSTSKIILSPPGISNPECFRHYEGLRAGCIVVTEKLPTKPQYLESPIIEAGNWSKGFEIIRGLLSNAEKMDKVSKASRDWYLNNLSPKPVAKYILGNVCKHY